MNQTEKNRILLGQRIAIGFPGDTLTPELTQLIREYKIGNIILFRRNIHTVEQTRKLCADLQALIQAETGLPAFIMLDEEGGTVSRLGELGTPTPSAMAVGAAGEPENAYHLGQMIGDELRAVGINVDLAPVLDCNTNPDNVVIGVRAFGDDPELVAAMGCRFADGLRQAGILPCGKHFPGHGDTAVDSHLGLPVVEKSREQIEQEELVSFRRAAENGIDALMAAHVVFPALDENRVPSTVSRNVLTGLLRQEMHYPGLVISDCMEMGAVKDLYGTPKATLMSLQAGIDIALVSHTEALQRESYQLAHEALEAGQLSMEECQSAYDRIVAAKARMSQQLLPEAGLKTPEHLALSLDVQRQAVKVLHAPNHQPLPSPGKAPLFIGAPATAASMASDGLSLNAAERLAASFGGLACEAPWEQAAQLLNLAPGRTAVVLLSRHPLAQRMADFAVRLDQAGARVIAISLHTPYCLNQLPDSLWKIAAYQYDEFALNRLMELLRTGK